MIIPEPYVEGQAPIYDEVERRRRRREHPFAADAVDGPLEPLLGTPEPDNVPQVGPAPPQADGYALQPGEELGVETDGPPTDETPEEAPTLTTRVVVSAMPSTAGGEQTVVAEVYPRGGGDPVIRWIRTLPHPTPLCTDERREHELAFAAGAGQLADDGSGRTSWQSSLYVCSRCAYAETDDATEPPPVYRALGPASREAAALAAAAQDNNHDRAAELRSRKDRGGRAVEREGSDS